MAIRVWPADPQKKRRRARVASPQAYAGQARIGPRPARAGLQAHIKLKKKNLHLFILIIFFMDSCINVSNSCITGKDKFYVIFNVLKFKEYIVYVIL